MVRERAARDESTGSYERAVAREGADGREWAVSHERTASGRAGRIERRAPYPGERAVSPESTRENERAVVMEGADIVERAVRDESTTA